MNIQPKKQRAATLFLIIVSLLLFHSSIANAALSDNLLHYYSFDTYDNNRNNTVIDSVGTNNASLNASNGEPIIGGYFTLNATGIQGNAYNISNFRTSTGLWINVTGVDTILNGNFTLQQWINFDGSDNNPKYFFHIGNGTKSLQFLRLSNEPSTLRLARCSYDQCVDADGASILISNGTWNHLVARQTYFGGDNYSFTIWINNQQYINITQVTYPGGIDDTIVRHQLFNSGTCASCNVLGAFDEIALWNRSVLPSEISSLYNSGLGINYSSMLSPGITWGTFQQNLTWHWNSTPTLLNFTLNATNQSADCSYINYSTNDTRFNISNTTGIVSVTGANLSLQGFHIVRYDAIDNCSNSIFQHTNISISYNAFNLTEVNITPRPTGVSNNLSCNYTLANPDNAVTTYEYLWYVNGTQRTALNNIAMIAFSNLSSNDTWICSIRANDTITIRGFFNSTNLSLSDNQSPAINNFSIDLTSITVSIQSIIATINCTDNDAVIGAYLQITDPNLVHTNYSMNQGTGNLWTRSFTPSILGLHYAAGYCFDGVNNINRTASNLTFTATAAVGGGGGGSAGGGGGDTIILIGNAQNFSISPLIKDVRARLGGKITNEFKITNTGGQDVLVNILVSEESSGLIRDRVLFGTLQNIEDLTVPSSVGLVSNTKFIRYTVTIPDDIPLGNYTVIFVVNGNQQTAYHTLKINVYDNIFTLFIELLEKPLFGRAEGYCLSLDADPELCINKLEGVYLRLWHTLSVIIGLIIVVRLSRRKK